jgi:hypothetical protein
MPILKERLGRFFAIRDLVGLTETAPIVSAIFVFANIHLCAAFFAYGSMGYLVGSDPGALANIANKPLCSIHIAREVSWLFRPVLHDLKDQYPSGILGGRTTHYRSKMKRQFVGGTMIHLPSAPADLAQKA